MRKTVYVPLIVLLIIAIDQATKYLVVSNLNPIDAVKVFPFLHLIIVRNTGAAFGMFKDLSNIFFIVISIIAIIFVLWLMIRGKESYFSLSLILGGAIGNLIDRIIHGHVIDFIDVSIGRFHWYTFNVADASLTVGVIMFFVLSLRLFKRSGVRS